MSFGDPIAVIGASSGQIGDHEWLIPNFQPMHGDAEMPRTRMPGAFACLLVFPVGACDSGSPQVEQQPAPVVRLVGRVRSLDLSRDVAYVVGRKRAVVVHRDAVSDEVFFSLTKGECVEFTLVEDSVAPSAEDIKALRDCPATLGDWGARRESTPPILNCDSQRREGVDYDRTKRRFAQHVRKIIAEASGVEQECITDDLSLVDDLKADSLEIIEIAMALEEEFEIEIPTQDTDGFATVGDVIRYIEKRTK